ncbi:hypothetical protein F5051DRAFT_340785 [Lentinula edodes]|uniref:uncharacterized protein n=1 Tax=Lentinula edodes TaxID=5353 RepID=UPI001E8D4A13|nr:uncharacterized protein C8R40DRAFT_1052900 [Lentinula edodes]KAH7872338.1 hypothetical protein C8R40DRAFT_1052900 [Lentinula edodes]KAJ3871514.1 hypothetical protein F5051DRAFT_340785 [Lentinula edodes]
MCYSISAQLLNPCGHTICGPCADQWLFDQGAETCPTCRRKTNYLRPLIPNITVNNFVESYIQICALTGDRDWQSNGSKLIDWLERIK